MGIQLLGYLRVKAQGHHQYKKKNEKDITENKAVVNKCDNRYTVD